MSTQELPLPDSHRYVLDRFVTAKIRLEKSRLKKQPLLETSLILRVVTQQIRSFP